MPLQAVHSWTLSGLIGAFLDLVLAYILLCISAFVFFASKYLSIFGLHLPCPCCGIFGYKNSDLCLHRLLIDWPTRIIYCVQKSVKSRFPFDLIWVKDQACSLDKKSMSIRDVNCENGVLELEDEASCSSNRIPKLKKIIDRESGYDSKGKRVINLKQRFGIRRRRRASLENEKFSSVLPNVNSRPVVAGNSPYDASEMRDKTNESLGPVSETEDGLQGEVNGPIGIDKEERTQHSFKLSGSFGGGHGVSSSVEQYTSNAPDSKGIVGNEANAIRMLEQVLEEEKAACAALYLELEKERAAAASAADEAMAMISRLQQDKASLEMEARQYQRMIEEKCAYDEEEMNILKEMLVRREMENHFLEKEIEEYMSCFEDELPKGNLNDETDNLGQKSSSSLDLNEDSQLMLQIENNKLIGKKVGENANWCPNYEAPLVKKQSQTLGYGFLEKNVLLAGKEKSKKDNSIICQGKLSEATQNCNGIDTNISCDGEELEKDGEDKDQVGSNLHSSILDTEPAVYDVHVIDDENETWKAQSGKESDSSTSDTLDEPRDFAVTLGYSGVWSNEALIDHPIIRRAGTEPKIRLDMSGEFPVLGHSRCKSLLSDCGRGSLSTVNSEKSKIDTEVEQLRERLRIVQEEKEKLTFYAEHGDREKASLKLLEEIANQLREIQRLREPVQQAS